MSEMELFAPDTSFYTPQLDITPRAYQAEAVESALKQFDDGIDGTLVRAATGTGKTPLACMLFDKWLRRGDEYRCMVISYEQELIWQFAEEIDDFLKITPGVEMSTAAVGEGKLPLITVASRQTLAMKSLATVEQRDMLLNKYGIGDIGLTTLTLARSLLKALDNGMNRNEAVDMIHQHNQSIECNVERNCVTRLHKFDPHYNWLVCFDEAHKYAMKLKTVGHLVEWFEKNPNSRRFGLTATPKRFDAVNIGSKLFPGIALDYPLVSAVGRSALSDGYAVPYIQKYINVKGVDFQQIKQVSGDFDGAELERVLMIEEELAGMIEPLLDLVGDRKTLVFSPGVEMAKEVAHYINARSQCTCECGHVQWHPKPLIGDGAKCKQCGSLMNEEHVTKGGNQANFVFGSIPKNARREIYRQHKDNHIQFLSVCGLCREGYNDVEISCVAVFRPVSKKASSLAEQMKGRGCRPLKNLVEGIESAEERRALIKASSKPDCLIIDLVGITGLGDCATTAQIYAEGVDDDVIRRAEELQLEGGIPAVEEAIQQAIEDVAEEREHAKQERERRLQEQRELAEKRAKAGASTEYTEHEVWTESGSQMNVDVASEKQMRFIKYLGMDLVGWMPSKRQAGRMIDMLMSGASCKDVAYKNGVHSEQWLPSGPSIGQVKCLSRLGVNAQGMTPKQASEAIENAKKGIMPAATQSSAVQALRSGIDSADTHDELTAVAKQISKAKASGELSPEEFTQLVKAGTAKRETIF